MTRPSTLNDFDPAWIASVAREVVRRLRSQTAESPSSDGVSVNKLERLITIETLSGYADNAEILADARAVVTPSAMDEARLRGLRIIRGGTAAATEGSTKAPVTPDSSRSCVLKEQLQRRGITLPQGIKLSWSEQPAAEVHRRCGRGERAVMVSTLADVQRFQQELAPQSWVLDREKLNLPAAVNIAARIAKLSTTDLVPTQTTPGATG